jgi:hypothetical protein
MDLTWIVCHYKLTGHLALVVNYMVQPLRTLNPYLESITFCIIVQHILRPVTLSSISIVQYALNLRFSSGNHSANIVMGPAGPARSSNFGRIVSCSNRDSSLTMLSHPRHPCPLNEQSGNWPNISPKSRGSRNLRRRRWLVAHPAGSDPQTNC